MVSSKMTDLFPEVPTQTRRSFAAMNMANAAEALLISRIKGKKVYFRQRMKGKKSDSGRTSSS